MDWPRVVDPHVVRHSLSPRATVVVHLADIEADRLERDEPTGAHLILAMLTKARVLRGRI